MFANFKKSTFTSVSILALAFLLMNLRHLNRPYVIDEATFPYGAIGILENGNPFFYNGETRPNDLALWHPPLYILSLALHMVFWGTSAFSVRLFGLICIGLTVVIVAFAINKLSLPTLQRNFSLVIFTGLFIFNPLISESALVPDIDGTIALPILAAGLLSCIVLIKTGWNTGLFLSFVTIWLLLFSTKFTVALLFLPIFVFASLLSGGQRIRHFLQGLSCVFLGFLLFVTGWKLLSIIMRAPFQAPFDYFTYSFQRKSTTENTLSDYVYIATHWDPRITMWVGPSLLLISILSAIALTFRSLKVKEFDPILILPIFAAYCFFGYNIIGGVVFTFPKYWVICVLPLAVLASLELSRGIANLVEISPALIARFSKIRTGSIIAITTALLTGINYVLSRRNNFENVFDQAANLNQILINATFAIMLMIFLFKVHGIGLIERKHLLQGVLAVAASISVFLAQFTLFALHRNSENSTTYYFNERGLSESIDLVKDIAPPGSVVIAPKDVGIQSGIPFYEDAFIAPLSEIEILEYIDTNKPSLVVTRNKFDYSESVYPQYFEAIRKKYDPVFNTFESDFVVWVPK